MKLNLIIAFTSLALGAFASPKFVTPDMIKRNGLTDEQYEMLWKQGKHPRIDIATARDWVFRSSRFQNVTNWLEVIGKTNDFARLVVPTMTTNEMLIATNKIICAINGRLERDIEVLKYEVDEVTKELEEAQSEAAVAKEIRKAAKRTEKNISKVVKELEKAKKKASDEAEKALWTSLIAILEGREPNAEVN